jgi:formylmethanofuran dehydrogenase subunit C
MLHLRCIYAGSIPLEAECVAPDRLATLTAAEVAALPVQRGNAAAALGDFFTVTGDPSDGEVTVEGDCRRVKWLGTQMAGGRLTVQSSAGMHVGSEMTGGALEVFGDVDDWAGAEMRGGRIHIHGSVGAHAGAAYPGSRRGMRGGELLIDGDAGDELGAAMRRGLIAVGGRTGSFAGAAMIAGTLVHFGAVGANAGAGMKRGSIMLFGGPPELLPTFRYDCTDRPVFVELYLRHLRAAGLAVPSAVRDGTFRRYRGDLVALGQGEVLVWHG